MDSQQDRYEIIETLGIGATSRVEKARDTLIGRTVALKTFLQGFGSRDLQQQFLREAQIIGGLSHPNIVALYDVGTNKGGAPYFVMEYVEGKTLESAFGGDPLPLARVAVWAGDLATALGQAHRVKIIHGDVKPANILVTRENQVKLGDFGVARFSTQASGSGNVLGTPAYLSPEQIQGSLQDSRSDLFSLGIVLYQMCAGVRPFDGDSVGAVCAQIVSSAPLPPTHYNSSLPPAFDQIVMRCLAKNPQDRFPTAEALAASLYPFARNVQTTSLASAPAAAPRPSTLAAAPRAKRSWLSRPFQRRDLWTMAALFLLISAASIARTLRGHAMSNSPASAATVPLSSVAPARTPPPEPGTASASIVISSTDLNSSSLQESSSPSAQSPSPLPDLSKPAALPASPRTKSRVTRPQTAPVSSVPAHEPSAAQPPAPAPSANPQLPSAPQPATLRVDIVSAIAEETLTVYAGQEVLFTTRLEAAHLGEPLHFDCPLAPGAHPLRVALYHADESLHLQKEGFAEILPQGSNTLAIHIARRAKLLIRKETALEVIWPNPHSESTPATSASALTPPSSK
jgi:serine/threonine protein kinase